MHSISTCPNAGCGSSETRACWKKRPPAFTTCVPAGDEGGKADLNEERAKLTKEKRIAAETENKVRNGELYRKSDITVGMTTVVMNLRSRLLALPNKLAANIAKLDGDEGKIMDLLQSSLYEIMEEFSNYQVALQPPKDDEEDEQDGEETG